MTDPLEPKLSARDEALRSLLREILYALEKCHGDVGHDQLRVLAANFNEWENEVSNA